MCRSRQQERNEEKIAVEKAEHAYEVLVAHWQPRRPAETHPTRSRRAEPAAANPG